MTLREAVERLVDKVPHDPTAVAIDKLLLRMFEYPALLAHLDKFNFDDESGNIEMQFFTIPKAILPQLKTLIAAPCETYEYDVGGIKRTGLRIHISALQDDGDAPEIPAHQQGGIPVESGSAPSMA